MREKNYFGRWKILCPTSFPANALANYLEEGDLKLMHTLHNQEIQRISPRNQKNIKEKSKNVHYLEEGGIKLMHTLHNQEIQRNSPRNQKNITEKPKKVTILRRGISKEFHQGIKKYHREIQKCSLSCIHSTISSILIGVRLKQELFRN